ncbi:hypothetical protein SAMN05660690_1624 [Geodermatophilus telluris]|uniref:Fibronectin type-III domain-containing protein n=1 Tax=Geodermatophilus telluris TaxID=1190417 RepID=A0A1G6M072_9ACTN|nr:hypothetical protein [Geodermatophilus telluris]SDC48757.1 hypothetical protein SAMN05660690_1624 [Geodermatophilus telluris]
MTRSRRPRRLPRRALAAVACAVALLALTAGQPGAAARFTSVTGNPAGAWATDGVAAPTGFSAAPTCVTTAITFRAATTATGTGTLTLTVPPGTVPGDLLLVHIAHAWTGAPFSVPAGWTSVRADNSANTIVSTLYWKKAVTGEPSATFGFPVGNTATMAGAMAAYTGADTTAPVDAHDGVVSTGPTASTPAVTTATAGTLVLRFVSNAHESYPAPAATTQRWRVGTVPGLGGYSAGDEQVAGAGPVASRSSASPSGTSAASVAQTLALRRAPGTPAAALTWTASPSTWATGYRLERSSGGTTQPLRSITPIGTTSATEGPLVTGTAYTFRLWAYRGTWTSTPVTASVTAAC